MLFSWSNFSLLPPELLMKGLSKKTSSRSQLWIHYPPPAPVPPTPEMELEDLLKAMGPIPPMIVHRLGCFFFMAPVHVRGPFPHFCWSEDAPASRSGCRLCIVGIFWAPHFFWEFHELILNQGVFKSHKNQHPDLSLDSTVSTEICCHFPCMHSQYMIWIDLESSQKKAMCFI